MTRVLLPVLSVFLLELWEFFAVRKSDSEVFAPKLDWRLFYGVFITCFLVLLTEYVPGMRIAPNGPPVWFSAAFVLVLLFICPKTLVVSPVGLSSIRLLRPSTYFYPMVSGFNCEL
jgi:hypothetical protein